MSRETLSIEERDQAFIVYCVAYAGHEPKIRDVQPHHAAAISLGAEGRMWEERAMGRAALAAKVEALLSDAEGDDEEPAPASHDPTADALAAYAEGVGDTLDALEKWARGNGYEMGPGPANLLSWVAASRASAPKRGMTAAQVLDRFDAWMQSTADFDCGDADALTQKIRREIEGGPHV